MEEIQKVKESQERQSRNGSAHHEQTFNTGEIVIMVCASDVAQRDYQYLGMSKVGESSASTTDQPTDKVLLQVLAVGNSASTLVKVGQVVLWPKTNLAVPQQISQSTSGNDIDEFADENTESEQPANDDQFMNYAMYSVGSRSRSMKYAFEAMRLLTCTKALFTEQMAHRIIHGQFINGKGGSGNNYSNDLKMETLVKDRKVILKGLCGNKTLKAVQRSTNAVYGLKNVVEVVDKESKVPSDSSKHTHASSTKIIQEMINVLERVKPFHEQPGRSQQKKLFENAFASSDDAEDDAHETIQQDDETDDQLSKSEEEMAVLLA
ncbi:Hypothetical predicted protein [Paramuricea clavata]|uniref:Uncharacterized protein n=1 Tax=Paramuricea clavata TaxID=317549 RepID=A0A6S7I2P4_PARCT|nr:Hypothetical predicted protein [Paramuricea clavata]